MMDMNIRDIDENLVNKAKAKALLEGKTLKDTVIVLLKWYISDTEEKKLEERLNK